MKSSTVMCPVRCSGAGGWLGLRRRRSPVRRVGGEIGRDLAFPPVAVRQQLLLVIEQLLARLCGEFVVRAEDDGVHRARLLAVAAVDALGHVDVVARGPAAAVGPGLALDHDALRRADRLAQLAGDAALLAVGVAPQGVLAAEARAQGT